MYKRKVSFGTPDHLVSHGVGGRLIPLHLKDLDCRSSGSALLYFPFIIDATKEGVAMPVSNKLIERGALTILPSLFLDA